MLSIDDDTISSIIHQNANFTLLCTILHIIPVVSKTSFLIRISILLTRKRFDQNK